MTLDRLSDVLRRLVPALIPIVMLFTSIRILLTPAFLRFEYLRPGFPSDTYGFSAQDRLHYSAIAVEAVLSPRPTDVLARLRFDDGSPAFNEREVGHMEDVRRLVHAGLTLWIAASAVSAAGLAVMAMRSSPPVAWEALGRGSWTTVWVMGGLGLLVLLAFPVFFTGFHRIFFSGDTWLFLYSDTLIRLFPLQFWQDASLGLALLTLAQALAGIGVWRVSVRLANRKSPPA